MQVECCGGVMFSLRCWCDLGVEMWCAKMLACVCVCNVYVFVCVMCMCLCV